MLAYVSTLALLGLAGGCCMVVTSLVTPYWVILADQSNMGLFSFCSPAVCSSINNTTITSTLGKDMHTHFKSVRGLVITGLIVGICGTLMALGFVADAIRSKGVKSLALLKSSLVLNPLAGIAIVLGASIYATTIYSNIKDSQESSLGFSFGLSICGGSSLLVSGVLVFIGGPRKVTSLPQQHRFSSPRIVLSCMQPPPLYTPPSEQFLVSQLQLPPAYEDKNQPPSYEDISFLPPPYEERDLRTAL